MMPKYAGAWVIIYERDGEPRRYVNEHGDEYVKSLQEATLYMSYEEARSASQWHIGERPMTVSFALAEDWRSDD